MKLLKDNISYTINILRTHYKMIILFKAYTKILTVISSHLRTIDKSIHQTLTKTGIHINKKANLMKQTMIKLLIWMKPPY